MSGNLLATWRWENILISLNFLVVLGPVGLIAEERSVYNEIMANYNKYVRPEDKTGAATIVSVELNSMTLLDLDQMQQTISFLTELEMIWTDELLKWNSSMFGNTTSVMLSSSLLWRPDITPLASTRIDYQMPEDQKMVEVFSDGSVRSSSPCVIASLCPLSVDAFPFDMQTCVLQLGSWMNNLSKIDLIIGRRVSLNLSVSPIAFVGNSEWTLISITASPNKYIIDDGLNGKSSWAQIIYTVQLKRKPIYYICVLLIPTFMTATICLFGLFVPASNTGERLEKVNMGQATLLSIAVILGIVAGEMPKTTTLPVLGYYVLAELFLCTIGVGISMIIMVAHQRVSTRNLQPPTWINIIVLFKMDSGGAAKSEEANTAIVNMKRRSMSNDQRTDQDIGITNLIVEARQVLHNVEEYIDDKKREENVTLRWIIIFDRIDTFFLILFNFVNIVMSTILLFD